TSLPRLHILLIPLLFSSLPYTPPPETSPLSLHDALPILKVSSAPCTRAIHRWCRPSATNPMCHFWIWSPMVARQRPLTPPKPLRSEEHTSELQSRFDLVCRLLLEKKNKIERD